MHILLTYPYSIIENSLIKLESPSIREDLVEWKFDGGQDN